jgi:hypothetical protein
MTAITRFSPRTVQGLHCPTARVQATQTVVMQRDCCGNVVAVVVERVPQAGDKDFVQCTCAEKKAESALGDGGARDVGGQLGIGVTLGQTMAVSLPVPIIVGSFDRRSDAPPPDRANAPLVPPPNFSKKPA